MLAISSHYRRALLAASLCVLCSCSSSGKSSAERPLTVSLSTAVELSENALLSQSIEAQGEGRLTYLLSGTDQQFFSIDSESGVLTSTQAFDYEHPSDSDGDRIFHLTVRVTDQTGQSVEAELTITLIDIQEHYLTITYPIPNANLGGVQNSTLIAGKLAMLDGSDVASDHGVTVRVNGTLATFDPTIPGRWHVELPVNLGTNKFEVTQNESPASIGQQISVQNHLLFNKVGLFDFDADQSHAYGLATGTDAVLKVATADWSAEVLFALPLDFEGAARCDRISAPILDEVRDRLIFVCEDLGGSGSAAPVGQSVMAYHLSRKEFQELLPSSLSGFRQATMANDKHLFVYGRSSMISWLDLETLVVKRYNVEVQPDQAVPGSPPIEPRRITASGTRVHVFDAPNIYFFDASAPVVAEASAGLEAGQSLLLERYEHGLGASSAEEVIATLHSYLLYSENGAIYEKNLDTGLVEPIIEAYADQSHLWSGRLLLNSADLGAGLFLYDEGSGASFQVKAGESSILGNATTDQNRLPNVTDIALSPLSNALMTFSRHAKQLNRVDLQTAQSERRGNFSSFKSWFGVTTYFDYNWSQEISYFCSVFNWGAGGSDSDAHVFSIGDSGSPRAILSRGALATYFNIQGSPYRLRTGGMAVDNKTGKLLLSAWGGEGINYFDSHFESLFWLDPESAAIEEIEHWTFLDGEMSEPYVSGRIDAGTRQAPLARYIPGAVAVLDLDNNAIQPVPVNDTVNFSVYAPTLDVLGNRILALAHERDENGNIVSEALLRSFDLSTGKVSLFGEGKWATGLKLSPGDMEMDNSNHRFFVTSDGLLLVVDSVTGARAIVGH